MRRRGSADEEAAVRSTKGARVVRTRVFRRGSAVLVVVLSLGSLAACETSDGGAFAPEGTAGPYPSACVDETVQALLTMEDPSVPAERPVDDPSQLLMYDRLTYRISGEDYLWYAVDRYVAPERVPEEYRFPEKPALEGVDPLTGVMFAAMWEMDCLPAGAVDQIETYLFTGEVPPGRG
jgi:hypothetical protein